eukprot:scaffold17481_cov69-Cylindrotheca_fusiformis.AAC.1
MWNRLLLNIPVLLRRRKEVGLRAKLHLFAERWRHLSQDGPSEKMKEELTTFLSHLDRLGWTAGAANPDFADLLDTGTTSRAATKQGATGSPPKKK